MKPTKKNTFYYFFEKICEVKNKISSTLVQLTLTFFNQTKRTAMEFEGVEKND